MREVYRSSTLPPEPEMLWHNASGLSIPSLDPTATHRSPFLLSRKIPLSVLIIQNKAGTLCAFLSSSCRTDFSLPATTAWWSAVLGFAPCQVSLSHASRHSLCTVERMIDHEEGLTVLVSYA